MFSHSQNKAGALQLKYYSASIITLCYPSICIIGAIRIWGRFNHIRVCLICSPIIYPAIGVFCAKANFRFCVVFFGCFWSYANQNGTTSFGADVYSPLLIFPSNYLFINNRFFSNFVKFE
jgi:hypothetical protein